MIIEKRTNLIRMSINNNKEEVLFLRLKSSSYSFYPFEYYLFWDKNDGIIFSEAASKSRLKIEDSEYTMRIRFRKNNRESLDEFFNLLDKTFPSQGVIESWNSLKEDIIISELKG